MSELKKVCSQDFKTVAAKPQEIEVTGKPNDARNWCDAIQRAHEENELQIAIIIAPGGKGNSPIYERVKHFCMSLSPPLPTQVVLDNTISRAKQLRNIMKNVLIQVCAKTQGVPWGFKGLPLMDVPTMICGIDITHHVGREHQSVLAFTASMDRYVGAFYIDSIIKENKNRLKKPTDIIFEIESLFQKAILKFKEKNGRAPERIIVYRDAVSEGQSEPTRNSEVPQLRQAIQKLKETGVIENDSTSFIYILCNKRIEQRFTLYHKGSHKNPKPGFVVDDVITRPNRFEFFILAHKSIDRFDHQARKPIDGGLQGPVRYEVIAMDGLSTLEPMDLYNLTYNLCYGYFNFQNGC